MYFSRVHSEEDRTERKGVNVHIKTLYSSVLYPEQWTLVDTGNVFYC